MDRLTLKQTVNKLIDDEVDLQSKRRATSELTIKITFGDGGIRQCRSIVEQILTGHLGRE